MSDPRINEPPADIADVPSLPRHTLYLRLVHTLGPIITTIVLAVVIWLFCGWEKVAALGTAAAIELSGPGKFIILGGPTQSLLNRFELAALVTYMDCASAFFLVFNIDLLYRIKRIGPILHEIRDFGHFVLYRNRWIRSLSFVGVALFVMFPVSGTGALGASILGRLIGMNRYRVMVAITLGASISCFGLAMLAGQISPEVANHWAFKYLGFPIFLVFVTVLGRRFRQVRRLHHHDVNDE